MHLPVFPLFTCASGRLSRLECKFVDSNQRKVMEDILELARGNVISFDLRQRLTDVSSAVRSLVV